MDQSPQTPPPHAPRAVTPALNICPAPPTRFKADLEEGAGTALDAQPVAGPVAPQVRHEVGDEGEVAGVDADAIRPKHRPHLPHNGAAAGLHTVRLEHGAARGEGGKEEDQRRAEHQTSAGDRRQGRWAGRRGFARHS